MRFFGRSHLFLFLLTRERDRHSASELIRDLPPNCAIGTNAIHNSDSDVSQLARQGPDQNDLAAKWGAPPFTGVSAIISQSPAPADFALGQ